jgi:large repetitive protein
MKNSLLVFLFLVTAIRGYSQCTLSVNLSSSGPAVCSGSSVVLTATASAGTAPYSYAWSTGEVTSTISVNKQGTYSVTVTDKTPGCQPVKKSITISNATAPPAPTAQNITICQNSSGTLTATAPGGTYQWYDAPEGGNFLASGASFTTPVLVSSVTYYVQTTLNGCTSERTPVGVSTQNNPVGTGATTCSGSQAVLSATGGGPYAWYASPSGGTVLGTGPTFTTPPLTITTTYYLISTAGGCVSAAVPVVATVVPAPATPTVSGATICSGSGITLHATAPTGVIDWFTAPSGGTSLVSSPDYTTPPLAATTTYYVQTRLSSCVSARIPVTVTVTPLPAAPVIADVTICSGSSAVLAPSAPGGPYSWYNALTGGTLLATGASYTTPVLTSSITYYVSATNGSCPGARTTVNVTVTAPPQSPSAPGAIICSGTTATLTAVAPGGVYQWYDAASTGNLLFTGAAFTTPALSTNTTYYVQTTVASCTSSRTPVTVTIMTQPSAPVAPGTTICSGGVATLNVTAPSGNYTWYDAATGGNLLTTGPVFITPSLTVNTTYYVEAVNTSGCASVRTPVIVTVNTPPGAPTASGTTICPGSVATLTATGIGTISWYDAALGGNLLATGSTFTTPVLSTTTTYYAEQTSGTCASSRAGVTVTVPSFPFPQFSYPSGTFCPSGVNPVPVINNASGGTFSAAPAGLVFVSTTTGQINLAASTPGTYSISFTNNAPCPQTTSSFVTISAMPNAQFSYAASYCQNAATFLPTFAAGASAGVFTASPAGLRLVDPSTGEVNPPASTPGTYTVTNTIAASGSCPASTFSTTLTIAPTVVVNAGPAQTVPVGTPVTMAGSVTGGATTGTWSGGTGTFSNPNSLTAVYTPGAGETSATLTLTSAAPPVPCSPQSATVIITFTSAPSAPTAAGEAICSGSVATLTATGPGGTYQWYNALTGGTLLSTGPTFVTPVLVSNTTYYVQTTVASVTSSRTAVTVTINAIPTAPVATGATICSGNTATVTATGSAGSYQWYDALTGGNLLSTNNSYTTTFLTTNTSYYVQSLVGGCLSARIKADVIVNAVPNITSVSTANICSGTALNYAITANVPGTTFTWSRPAVANISNPAVTNQATSPITETLLNTGSSPVNVTYIITPVVNTCTGTPFNYVVTVNPSPSVSSAASITVCSGSPVGYNITFNNPAGVSFTWSRAVVAGISNAPITGQASGSILESLFNTTNAPVDVTYVISYQTANCSISTFNLVVTVNPTALITSALTNPACSGVAQNYVITSNVPGATFTWSRPAVVGISNLAVTGQTSGTITESLINTTFFSRNVVYTITPMANGCPGTPFQYTVAVNPQVPVPKANSNSPVCTGTDINLQTPTISGATYSWTGPNSFTSALQNPTINNATTANSGTYTLVITLNGCNSSATTGVAVDPLPVVTAQPVPVQCTNVASVPITGTVVSSTNTGAWSTNGTGSFGSPQNSLTNSYNPSAADIAAGSVVLTLSSTSPDNCSIITSPITITFKSPSITSSATAAPTCSGTAISYTATSDFPAATFNWGRVAIAGISNPAVSNQNANPIVETLINTTASPIVVSYTITPLIAGCPGTPFIFTVTVNPVPQAPTATSNSPVCINTTINLQTPTVAGAIYSWTGPNSFTSAQQNPPVPNATAADAGTYSVTVTVAGCQSPAGTVSVAVDPLPTVDVGPNKNTTICPSTTSVQLAGSLGGGATGGKWTTNGSGTFTGGGISTTVLNGQYFPSAQDVTNGSVTLTLASTSNDNCAIATAQFTIAIHLLTAVTAGPDQSICSQSVATLGGQITIGGGGVWSSSGTGTFSPSANLLISHYIPSTADIATGSVVLTLTANNAGQCYIPTDQLTIKLIPPPTVSAGKTIFVLKGHTMTLSPTVSDPDVTYSWSPDIDISSTTIENPTITGNVDRTYSLTVTDSRGCQSTSSVNVVVSPEIIIPNTFTPNGDGINDLWNIQGLTAYQQATIDVFDRNGQKIFHSVGYGTAWDGTYKGQQVPYGVYYYIIDPKTVGLQVLSGSITVIR